MTTNRTLGSLTASAVLSLLMGGSAAAQYGGMPGGGMGPPSPSQQKQEGPAEAAPEEEERPGDLEPQTALTAEGRRRTQIIELNGYFRLRSDYMHQFDLEQNYAGSRQNLIHPPFPCPISNSGNTSGDIPKCTDHNLGSVNTRLRLEPTINITESVRVMTQIDVLDNVIMGSTPNSLYNNNQFSEARTDAAPTGALATYQNPPEPGQSSFFSSIRAKRAWGEVDSEFGSLRFGRMPWRFGRGMLYNDGSCPDCDNGNTVDRIMAITQLYSHQFALAWDFGAQGFTTQTMNVGPATVQQAYPLDLSQKDDVTQLMFAVTRIEDPRKLQERIDRGELVFNYGFQLVYRSQEQDLQPVGANDPNNNTTPWSPPSSATTTTNTNTTLNRDNAVNELLTVNALSFTPDLWAKLYWKNLTVEAEVASVLGKMDRGGVLTASDPNAELKIMELGWVVAGDVSLYNKTFFVGLETGGATGDRAEDPLQYLNVNYRFVPRPLYSTTPSKARMTDFKFSPDYHVDQIFFRQIMGTVTNAVYIKPQLAYWLDLSAGRKLGISGAGVYSLALVPVSTPGNSVNLGAEVDLSATYRNTVDGFYAGITWGVFWPFGALQRPQDLQVWNANGAVADASAAQTLRVFLGLRF